MKKHILYYCLFALMALTFASCGSDNDDDIAGGGGNANANATTSANPYVTRLEFPKVKGGGSIVITHKTSDKYGVNYSVEWDCEKKSQRWSCYQMYYKFTGNAGRYDPDTNPGNHSGEPQYPFDPKLPDGSYYVKQGDGYISDYFYRSGFDHGHIIPSADRQYSKEANYQTFYMSNMQPQYNKFNAKLWSDMEAKVRAWSSKSASNTDTLYVCKGGTIDNENQILTRIQGKQIVPKYFFMALLMKNNMGYRAIAFWAEHENVDRSGDNLANYVISIDELESRTGIDFFCNLPDDIENHVEANVALSAWGLRK